MKFFLSRACIIFPLVLLTFCSSEKENKAALDSYLRGNIYYKNKELSKAIEYYDNALEIDSGFNNARLMKAKALFYSNKLSESEELVDTIIENEPSHIGALLLLSKILVFSNKDLDKALTHLTTITDIDPDHMEARIMLALIHEQAGDNKNAIKEYLYLINNEHYIITAHINLAILYEKIGLSNRSLDHFQKARQISQATDRSTDQIDALLQKREQVQSNEN